jgi:hypothetical protein
MAASRPDQILNLQKFFVHPKQKPRKGRAPQTDKHLPLQKRRTLGFGVFIFIWSMGKVGRLWIISQYLNANIHGGIQTRPDSEPSKFFYHPKRGGGLTQINTCLYK